MHTHSSESGQVKGRCHCTVMASDSAQQTEADNPTFTVEAVTLLWLNFGIEPTSLALFAEGGPSTSLHPSNHFSSFLLSIYLLPSVVQKFES